MSIESVNEIHNGRDGSDSVDSGVEAYTRVFRVITGTNLTEADEVKKAAGIPLLGEPYPDNINATCTRRHPKNDSTSKRVWRVTCSYKSVALNGATSPIPTDDPAVITWGTEIIQKPIYTGATPAVGPTRTFQANQGTILNSAGDFFDPLPEVDDARIVATVTKNVGYVSAAIFDYINKTNDATFFLDGVSVPKDFARIRSVNITSLQWRNSIPFRTVTLRLLFGPVSEEILDAGFRQRTGVGAPQTKIPGLVTPALLDGGMPIENPTPENAKYITYFPYATADFSTLPLY